MGAGTPSSRMAGNAAANIQASQAYKEGIKQRQAAIKSVGEVSMFPGEAPQSGATPVPVGLEEASFRRNELTRERDRPGRREQMYADFQIGSGEGKSASVAPGGAIERGAGVFGVPFGGAGQGAGLRSGIAFGPGRSTRMPEVSSPEYQQLINRVRNLNQR